MQKNIYIIRHGETAFNKLGIVQGSGVDTDLNDTGRAQAAAFYQQYENVDFQLVITSLLKRTAQTVQPFLERGVPQLATALINEINWGAHEGKKSSPESRENYRATVTRWKSGDYTAHTTDGESAEHLAQRLTEFLALVKSRPEQIILVATHGRTLRALICLLKNEPLLNMDKYDHFNTGLVLAHLDDDVFSVSIENDISHLPSYEHHNVYDL
jgi:phosphoserine phosphatase